MTARDLHAPQDEPMSLQATMATTEPNLDPTQFDSEVAADARWATATTPARVAALLSGQASRIVANWVVRAANLPAFRAVPNWALDRLEDAVPALLDAALSAIAYSDPTMDPEPLGRALELAAEHGQTRANEGFGIGVLLAEYQHLRMEVWNAVWRIVDSDPAMVDVPRELQARLSSTFDSLAAAAAEAWVERRLATGSASNE